MIKVENDAGERNKILTYVAERQTQDPMREEPRMAQVYERITRLAQRRRSATRKRFLLALLGPAGLERFHEVDDLGAGMPLFGGLQVTARKACCALT